MISVTVRSLLENALVPALAERDRGPGRPRAEILERARGLLEFVTLDRLRHALARQLSGGQSMLLQIARAMALLELDGIVAGYVEGIDILNDVRLRVEAGSITGIIGSVARTNGVGRGPGWGGAAGGAPPVGRLT